MWCDSWVEYVVVVEDELVVVCFVYGLIIVDGVELRVGV